MHDLEPIFRRLRDCADEPVALVTLLTREGSAYRQPGARMLVTRTDAWGVLSGGCLEASLIEIARTVIDSGKPRLVPVDTARVDDALFGLGVGCPGALEFLVQPLRPSALPHALTVVREQLSRRERCVLVTEIAAPPRQWAITGNDCATGIPEIDAAARDALERGRSSLVTAGHERYFVEAIGRPVQLLVVGAGDNAQPVVRIARELGWSVVVNDRRAALVTKERFPEASTWIAAHASDLHDDVLLDADAAVLLSHHRETDLELLPRLLATSSSYIGLLGSVRRCAELFDELQLTPDQRARVHGPIGLDIGAEGPHEIALAIVAEIRAVLSHRAGEPLSRRTRAHA